jgi:peptidoglycan/LPS O-acetylase OafA/YrhL
VAALTVAERQDSLDGVRAVAAFGVLLFHVAGASGLVGRWWVFHGGQVGVPVFFALSGLLLYRPWVRAVLEGASRPSSRAYLRRRAMRILPAYWALVVVVMASGERDRVLDLPSWVELLSLTYIYEADSGWTALGPRQMGQAWSLCVEVAFYLSLPLTAAVLGWWACRLPAVDVSGRARRLLSGLGCYSGFSVVYTVLMFVPSHQPRMGAFLPRHFAWFGVGMALCVVTIWARREGGRVAEFCRAVGRSWDLCWLVGALLVVVVASPLTGAHDLVSPDSFWTSQFHVLFGGLAAFFLVAPVALAPEAGPIRAVLGNRPMRFLGRISYGVFLWQSVIILGWFDLTGRLYRGNLLIDLPIVTLGTVGAALLSYHLIERRLPRPRHAPAEPAEPTVGPARSESRTG